eukprot:TRINITY_DN3487_c0_g1_i11.p1 TRINITY_DN3487_c0_g1~~TRINITY_DN3487_c0_g1_i11.p1  ORF type:complete len:814 (+),score=105.72 TRINITY_DN3487_c0_g1_i11:1603-4044(+)
MNTMKNTLRSQRRTVMFSGGKSSQWGKNLVNFEKGEIEYEPGYVPQAHGRVDRQIGGTWRPNVRGGLQQKYPRPDRTKNATDGGKYTPPFEDSQEILPYAEWDRHMPHPAAPGQGLSWEDMDPAQVFYHERVLSTDLEAVELHPHIISALNSMGINKLTRSQYEALYKLRRNTSMLLASSPASGKSSAVVWYILNKLLKEYPNAPFSTVYIVPTESLARQILRWFVTLGKLAGVLHDKDFCLCVSSKNMERNFEELMQHRPSVMICTPERLGELIHTKNTPFWSMSTTTLQRIVVDEADSILNPHDQDAIGNVLLHGLKRNDLYSAPEIGRVGGVPSQLICVTSTAHNALKDHLKRHWLQSRNNVTIETHLGKSLLRNVHGAVSGMSPKQHNAEPFDTRTMEKDYRELRYELYGGIALQKDIEHVAVICTGTHTDRLSSVGPVIKSIISHQNASVGENDKHKNYFRGLLIVKTPEDASIVAKSLYANGLEGRVGRMENPVALKSYADGQLPLLISLAENVQGMDLPYLTHVLCCLPINSPAEYVKLAGRVGRAGRTGVSYVFQLPSETRNLKVCEDRLAFKFHRTKSLSIETDGVNMPSFFNKVEPARKLIEGEGSKDFAVNPHILPGTANADVSLIKSLVVDDVKYLDTLEEDSEPYHLTELDNSRNYLTASGKTKPIINQKMWSGGSSPATLYNKEELSLLHRQNKYAFLVRPGGETNVISASPERTQLPMVGGSMNPDNALKYHGGGRTGPTREGRRPLQDISEQEGVQFDINMVSRLVDARSGHPLAQTGNYNQHTKKKKKKKQKLLSH